MQASENRVNRGNGQEIPHSVRNDAVHGKCRDVACNVSTKPPCFNGNGSRDPSLRRQCPVVALATTRCCIGSDPSLRVQRPVVALATTRRCIGGDPLLHGQRPVVAWKASRHFERSEKPQQQLIIDN